MKIIDRIRQEIFNFMCRKEMKRLILEPVEVVIMPRVSDTERLEMVKEALETSTKDNSIGKKRRGKNE